MANGLKSGTISGKRTEQGTTMNRLLKELLIYAAVMVVGYLILIPLDLYDQFYEFSRLHEDYELDEIILLLPVTLVCVVLFALFRLRDLRARTAELQRTHARLEEMSRAREEFMTVACHELKSPLNGIVHALRLMEILPDEAERKESAELAQSAAVQLGVLIDDVREFSLLGQDALMQTAAFDLPALVEAVGLVGRFEGQTKNLSVRVELDPGAPQRIVGSESALRLILLNLIGNAVRYTERGGVQARVSYRDGARPELVVEVEDTGKGIAPEDQERIFEPYTRLDKHSGQGLGLGLAIVRRLAVQLGGSVSVESEPGSGSVFTVILPVTAA